MSEEPTTPLAERKSILQINLGTSEGLLDFESLDEIEQWLKQEREATAWLLDSRFKRTPPIAAVYGRITQPVTHMEQHLTAARRHNKETTMEVN